MTVTLNEQEYKALINAKAMADAHAEEEVKRIVKERIDFFYNSLEAAIKEKQVNLVALYRGDPFSWTYQNEFQHFLGVLKKIAKETKNQ